MVRMAPFSTHGVLIMAALWNRAGHYIFVMWFLRSSIFFFSSPILSSRRLDVYHTSTHGVAFVRINLGCISETCCTGLAENSVRIKSPKIRHLRTIAQLCEALSSQQRQSEKLVKQQYLPTCPHNMVNFGPLAAEICWRVWGTPTNFNGFCLLAALLHGILVVGISQTVALNRGRHLYSAGRPSRWALAHILVFVIIVTLH